MPAHDRHPTEYAGLAYKRWIFICCIQQAVKVHLLQNKHSVLGIYRSHITAHLRC